MCVCVCVHRLLSALGLSDEGGDTPAANGGSSDAAAAAGSSGGGSSSGALAALSGSAEARGHVFSALAQLANRMPDLFKVWGGGQGSGFRVRGCVGGGEGGEREGVDVCASAQLLSDAE